jgi:hypothetical protein
VGLNVNLQALPDLAFVLDSFAGRADGQQTAQQLHLIERFFQFGDKVFPGSGADS